MGECGSSSGSCSEQRSPDKPTGPRPMAGRSISLGRHRAFRARSGCGWRRMGRIRVAMEGLPVHALSADGI